MGLKEGCMKPIKRKVHKEPLVYNYYDRGYNRCLDEYKEYLPSEEEIFEIVHKTIVKDSDRESRIWFSDTSWNIAKAIHKRITQ